VETDEVFGSNIAAGEGFVLLHSTTVGDEGGVVRVIAPDSRGIWQEIEVLREGSSAFGYRVAIDQNRFFIGDAGIGDGDEASIFASGEIYEYRFNERTQDLELVNTIERPKTGISSFGQTVAYSNGWFAAGAPLDQNGTAGGLEGGKVFLFRESEEGDWAFHQEIEPFDVDMKASRMNYFSDKLTLNYPWMAVFSSVGYNSLAEEQSASSVYLYRFNELSGEWEINHKIETVGLPSPTDGFGGISELVLAENELIFSGSDDEGVRYLSHFQYDEETDQWSMVDQFDYGEIDDSVEDTNEQLRFLGNFANHIELHEDKLYVGGASGRGEIIDGIQYSYGQVRIYERASFSSPWEEIERIEPPMLTEHEYPPNPRRTNSFGDEFSFTAQGELFVFVGGRVYGERGNGNVLLLTTENNEKSIQIEHAVETSNVQTGDEITVEFIVDNLSSTQVTNVNLAIDLFAGTSSAKLVPQSSSHNCWYEDYNRFFRCKIDSIGGNANETVELTFSAPTAGDYDFDVEVLAAPQDSVPENRQTTFDVTVASAPPSTTPESSGGSSGSSAGLGSLLALLLMLIAQRLTSQNRWRRGARGVV